MQKQTKQKKELKCQQKFRKQKRFINLYKRVLCFKGTLDRGKQRQREGDLTLAGSLPTWLPWSGLDHNKSKSQEPGIPGIQHGPWVTHCSITLVLLVFFSSSAAFLSKMPLCGVLLDVQLTNGIALEVLNVFA